MNLYESLGTLGINPSIDYYKFSLKLVGISRRLVRSHVYTGSYDQLREPDKYKRQIRFFNKIHRMPFVTLKTRTLICRNGIFIQKGVDTLIATDLVTMAFLNHYEAAVLVSGDGDVAPAADAVKAAGKQIIVATFPRSRSTAIAQSADQEVILDKAFISDCY
jgi:uncharacterized LabA/DUF88 family protein